jgi:hypothetical protein
MGAAGAGWRCRRLLETTTVPGERANSRRRAGTASTGTHRHRKSTQQIPTLPANTYRPDTVAGEGAFAGPSPGPPHVVVGRGPRKSG